MKRYGSVIGLSEEGKAEYKRLHAAVWPGVLARIAECNIRNYSIFLKEPENLLFSYFETKFNVTFIRLLHRSLGFVSPTLPVRGR